MQLYIRSQDKRKLIQMGNIVLENVDHTNTNNPNTIHINTTSTTNVVVSNHKVGKYETIDRAMEVMNEIIGILEKSNRLMVSPNTKGVIKEKEAKALKDKILKDDVVIKDEIVDIQKLSVDVVVYQMPEK